MRPVSRERREARAAVDRALFREINEKLLALNEVFGELVGTFTIVCECSRTECVEILEIPPATYRAIRHDGRTFAIRADHVESSSERVIGKHDGYAVVELVNAPPTSGDGGSRQPPASET
jgi:hypothetical protein